MTQEYSMINLLEDDSEIVIGIRTLNIEDPDQIRTLRNGRKAARINVTEPLPENYDSLVQEIAGYSNTIEDNHVVRTPIIRNRLVTDEAVRNNMRQLNSIAAAQSRVLLSLMADSRVDIYNLASSEDVDILQESSKGTIKF